MPDVSTVPLDEAAVAELYRRYGHALFRRCLTLVGREAEAHELVQEVFCQFWGRRDAFAGRSSVFTYLYRIATNLAIDRLRRRRTAGAQLDFDEARQAGDPGGRPDHATLAAEELAVLTRGLDEETLTIAVLAHVDGLTQDEIAAATELSRRTVGKKLTKFLEHTRKRSAAGAEFESRRAAVRAGDGGVEAEEP